MSCLPIGVEYPHLTRLSSIGDSEPYAAHPPGPGPIENKPPSRYVLRTTTHETKYLRRRGRRRCFGSRCRRWRRCCGRRCHLSCGRGNRRRCALPRLEFRNLRFQLLQTRILRFQLLQKLRCCFLGRIRARRGSLLCRPRSQTNHHKSG
jgi:hypothetical protein